ncbi:MAG: IMP cyclohydrolase [Nanoarchaeota archaeon]|nr:IMP cyclohydrolase [Nanoarchaeota archaeon]
MVRGTDVTGMKRSYRTVVEGEFPDVLSIGLQKESDLRYGENPNQPAAMYKLDGINIADITNIRLAKSGKGGLSATNFMDVTRALEILKFFEVPSVAVMKHLVPSGFARQYNGNSLDNIYQKARDADARSAFGSVVVLNRSVDKATAEAIMSSYVEGVAAPEFEEGAMEILERKKDIRAILYSNLDRLPKFVGDDINNVYDIKGLPTGRVLVQKPYLSSVRSVMDLVCDPLVEHEGIKHVVERDPTQAEIEDLLTSWYVNLGVRSNGIVFVKNGVTVAVGTGQQERVGAIEQAIIKSYQKTMDKEGIKYDAVDGAAQRDLLSRNPLKGSVMSSDAFFPFRDSIDIIARHGVTAVIQPGGSVRDYEVIDAVNEHKMAMTYTLERCFGHF